MSGGGLLRKAENLLAANGTDGRRPSGEAGAGISREDQQDILVHIDQVAQSNRILAGPDTWIVKPSKKGFIAPFLVNLCAAAVLAGGLYALWVSFEDTDPLRLETAEALPTAEGRLLQEIHREAEGRILEKDRQITAIQERMRVLDQERGQLLASVDDRIRTRELELRVRLAEELERE
ncbi:MAG TPA: hypothetical protein VLH39_03600, partial [Magnetospirillaceae bacterium]|nr:hypothetical protein [Magnetospirillaceae bacterium]